MKKLLFLGAATVVLILPLSVFAYQFVNLGSSAVTIITSTKCGTFIVNGVKYYSDNPYSLNVGYNKVSYLYPLCYNDNMAIGNKFEGTIMSITDSNGNDLLAGHPLNAGPVSSAPNWGPENGPGMYGSVCADGANIFICSQGATMCGTCV